MHGKHKTNQTKKFSQTELAIPHRLLPATCESQVVILRKAIKCFRASNITTKAYNR